MAQRVLVLQHGSNGRGHTFHAISSQVHPCSSSISTLVPWTVENTDDYIDEDFNKTIGCFVKIKHGETQT
jgi:hypothetical protein